MDNGEHVESIVLLSKLKSNKLKHISVELELAKIFIKIRRLLIKQQMNIRNIKLEPLVM